MLFGTIRCYDHGAYRVLYLQYFSNHHKTFEVSSIERQAIGMKISKPWKYYSLKSNEFENETKVMT